MVSRLKIGPPLDWPRFPDFPAQYYDETRTKSSKWPNRHFYDWTVYTSEGLRHAEAYWDEGVSRFVSLLPTRMAAAPTRFTGINLGTFNGAFQKAWMRRGYKMYGIELFDTMEDLHSYGCEGHRDDIYDLSQIPDGKYDFGVLDRVICLEPFHREYESEERALGRRPVRFDRIRRILKNDGAFIGVLYDWYSKGIIEELASLGGLTLSAMKAGRIAFSVDLSQPATTLPGAHDAKPDSELFTVSKIAGERVKLFIPTNEALIEKDGKREFVFAPPLREADRAARPKRPVARDRLEREKD